MTEKMISQPYRPQENSLQDWKKADARILGQILAAQNVVFTLPDTARIAEFYAQALIAIPGITACRVCLGGKSALAGEMASGACAGCETLRRLSWEAGTLMPTDSGFKCNLADQPGMQVMAIDADQHRFGFFVLQINQANLSGLYHPFVRNLAGYVALMLENRWQKKMLQKANDELERKVEERTHELIAANEALAASRGAALEMMKTAVEARQRSEQASADLEREVAEHKRLEREYRTLVETVPDFIVRYDLDLQRVYVNPAWKKASGLSAAQVVGVAHTDIPKVPSPAVDEYVHALQRVMQTGDSQTTEFTWENATGETLLLEYRIVPEYDQLGRIAGVLAVGRDITERKRAQEKLEKERALLRCLIDSASDLIFIKDQDSVYRACNKASEAFIGIPEREQIGKTDYDFFDLKKAEEIRKTDRRVFDEGKPLHIEEWVTNRDGRRLLMDTIKTPYYDPDGKPLGLVGIGRDLTERKLLEQDRLAHLRFLETMDKINRAIQGADELEKMMKDLLDVVLTVFDCDRSYLLYPCDPGSSTWFVPMVRNKPEYPSDRNLKQEMKMEPHVAQMLRILLAEDGPVKFGPGLQHSLPEAMSKQFSIKSCMAMAVYLRTGSTWQFGIHQCAYARTWTKAEERLFQEIGRRLADGLSSMLSQRDLRSSLEKLEQAQRLAHIGSWELDLMDDELSWSNEVFRIFEIDPEKFDGSHEALLERVHPEDRKAVNSVYTTSRETKTPFATSYRLLFPDGRTKYIDAQCETYLEGDKPIRLIGTVQDITERALAEEALRESERKLGEAARIAHVGYWYCDYAAETIVLSEEACRIFGLPWPCPFSTLSEWHEQWIKIIHPEDQPGEDRAARNALTGGPPYNVKYRVVRSDGDVRDIHSYAEVTRNESGKPLRMFGTMVDITERKRAEERLRASEERLRLTLKATQIGAFDWDVEHDAWFASPEYYTMFGYEPKDGVADRNEWLARVHPDDRGDVEARVREVLAREPSMERSQAYEYEARIKHADGTYRWEQVKGLGVQRDREGRVTRLLGIRMDITERRQAEVNLRESEKRFRELFNKAAIPLCFINKEKGNLDFNAQFQQVFGYSPDDIPTMNEWWQMAYPDPVYRKWVLATCEVELQKAVKENSSLRPIEYRVTCKNGDILDMVVSGSTIGEYFLLTFFDVTERKQAEEEIRKLNQELEQRVADRTAQLQAANKELEAFAYSVSHDLRAPLRHIDGFVELLQDKQGTRLDEQSRHYMDTIADSAKKMGQLIDDLLYFSRTGRQAMSFHQVALQPVVQDVIRDLEPESIGRIIEWRIGDLPTVFGDAAMLRVVMVNLISNALKFTRPRRLARIEIGSLPDQTSETKIFVRDNGVGFDMTYADRLFGVFQRLHRSDDFEGTGIGLASVRRIIARHGGNTWAQGELDQGATFFFTLPHSFKRDEDERP